MSNLSDLITTNAIYIPWPTFINGSKQNGQSFTENVICNQKCSNRECQTFNNIRNGALCNQGLTYYQARIGSDEIICYGMTGNDRSKIPKTPFHKAHTKGRQLLYKDFSDWLHSIKALTDVLGSLESKIISRALHPLHDTMKWAEQINTIAERIIIKDRNKSFDENFESSAPDLKSIYKASRMLTGTFETLTIYNNPDSASYGQRRPIELYKLIHKLQILLNLSEGARQKKTIKLNGNGYKTYYLYESFNLIPFSLLQNALKYSQTDVIELKIEEERKGAKIYVSSVGPLIEEADKERIFHRGFRCSWAKQLDREGMGVGLYIAKTVADAHDIQINITSDPLNYSKDSIPQAKNCFSFLVNI